MLGKLVKCSIFVIIIALYKKGGIKMLYMRYVICFCFYYIFYMYLFLFSYKEVFYFNLYIKIL